MGLMADKARASAVRKELRRLFMDTTANMSAGLYGPMLDAMQVTLAAKEIYTSQTLMNNYLSGGALTYAKPPFLRAMVEAMHAWCEENPEHAFPTGPMMDCVTQLPLEERRR
jgi:hypothetical protein